MKLRVGIIFGGCSEEYKISLQSALNIIQNIDKCRFEVILLYIDKQGCWYWDINNINAIELFSCRKNNQYISILLNQHPHRFMLYSDCVDNILKIDVIFPITHGTLGEDGSLQGLLNIMHIPFVGSSVLGSSICMNKDVSKRLLRDYGLSVTPFETFLIHEKNDINFDKLVSFFKLPFFIKPTNQGSSIGVSKVINYESFIQGLSKAFLYSNKILIESAIIGREIECSILGNVDPIVSVCGEIIFQKNDEFYTYDSKYICNETQITIPAKIDDIISNKIRSIALIAFRVLNCLGMARIDFFLTVDNQIIINEVNTLPGFTNNSMYPKLWEYSGISRKMLITKLIELALDLYK